jgi:hypothetical protein
MIRLLMFVPGLVSAIYVGIQVVGVVREFFALSQLLN